MTTVSEIPVEEIKTESLDREFIEYIQQNPDRVATKVLVDIKTLTAQENATQNQSEVTPTETKGPVNPEPVSRQTPAQQGQTVTPPLKKSEVMKSTTAPELTPQNMRGIMGHIEVPEGTVIPAGGVEITLVATRLRSSRSKIEQFQTTVRLEPGQWKANYMIGVAPNYELNDGYVVNYAFNPAQLPGIQPKGYYWYQDEVGLKIVTKAQAATLVDVSHGDRGGVDLFLANYEESKL